MRGFLKLSAIFAADMAVLVFSAWGLLVLWGWFAVPIFGLVPLTMVSATGVLIVISYLTGNMPSKEPTEEEMIFSYVYKVLRVPMYLLMGFIVKLFI